MTGRFNEPTQMLSREQAITGLFDYAPRYAKAVSEAPGRYRPSDTLLAFLESL